MEDSNRFEVLPIGSIKPTGWLLATLEKQAAGLTGSLDKISPRHGFKINPVTGDSVWRGGKSGRDCLEIASERAPYYIRGLVATAYLLNDQTLQGKAGEWFDHWFSVQSNSGNLEAQGVSSYEWWPRMLIVDALRFYYEATGEQKAINFIERFFHFQKNNLEKHPLTKNIRYLPEWRSWASFRGGDNMESVFWLYRQNGDPSLPGLAKILSQQTYPWEKLFLDKNRIHTHAVNLAHGLRKPAVEYQFNPDHQLFQASKVGLRKTVEQHGHISGSLAGDEQTSGRGPTAGVELCTTIEYMRTLQTILAVFGNLDLADLIEKLAYNALPAAIAPDFRSHQYFSQANQAYCTLGHHGFHANKADFPPPIGPWYKDALAFGAPVGYPCCIFNLHLGWPLFISSMWMKQEYDCLAAMLYGPCRVETEIRGVSVTIAENTMYPFSEEIKMEIMPEKPLNFTLLLRIPEWCQTGQATVNGDSFFSERGSFLSIQRYWQSGDIVTLKLPMKPRLNPWQKNALSVERGPLLFTLNPAEKWVSLGNSVTFPTYEVVPGKEMAVKNKNGTWDFETGPCWNYSIIGDTSIVTDITRLSSQGSEILFPWDPATTPVKLCLDGMQNPAWQRTTAKKEGGLNAGPLPLISKKAKGSSFPQRLILTPYGSSRLRISIFPEMLE